MDLLSDATIHKLTTILSNDEAATEKMEVIYNQLGLTKADLINIKNKLKLEGGGSYGFFSATLSKWRGGLGKKATVQALVKELEEIGGLEDCIDNICSKFEIPRLQEQKLSASEQVKNVKTEAPNPKDDDFSMNRENCNRVREIIENDHVTVMDHWSDLKESFLSKAAHISTVDKLLKSGDTGEAISKTFAFWIECSKSNTDTFKTMVSIFRRKDYVKLADELEKNITYIRGTTE